MKATSDKSTSYFDKTIGWASFGAGVLLAANLVYRELTRYDFNGKVVVITGGSRGLGLVLARQLAAKGAKLAICARSVEQLKQAKEELERLGAEVIAPAADLSDRDRVQHLIEEIIYHYGQIDVLINNAGIIQVGPQDALDLDDYEEAMQINFWAPLYTMLGVIPHFKAKEGGRIVNITSIGGKIAVPHLLPYTVSKFALVGLSEGMHAELKKHNIHVTTVVPNLMRTGSPRNITVKGNHEAEYAWFKITGSSPLLAQKAEVAAKNIIRSIEYGESEAILSMTGKIMTIMKGIAPGWVNVLLSLANQLLPDNVPGGTFSKKGYESESRITESLLTALGDKAAKKNNEY